MIMSPRTIMFLSQFKRIPVWKHRSILLIHLMGIIVQTMIVLKGVLYILIHTEINLRVIFLGLTVVVDSRLCQLYCQRLIRMIESSNILWFCLDFKREPVCVQIMHDFC
jgi:hypothetical protein